MDVSVEFCVIADLLQFFLQSAFDRRGCVDE